VKQVDTDAALGRKEALRHATAIRVMPHGIARDTCSSAAAASNVKALPRGQKISLAGRLKRLIPAKEALVPLSPISSGVSSRASKFKMWQSNTQIS
jgi:hypothetical protein